MKYPALTGISPAVIKELKEGKPRTIELQSTHNIVTVAGIEPGPNTHIFLTSVGLADLGPGDQGICAIVLSTSISMKRVVEYAQGAYFEERERMSARLQIKYCGLSVVKKVYNEGLTLPTEVDALKASCTHAG